MYQGFYNLTSGMLTQSRNIDVVGNNMVNITTPGYKKDTMLSTTFGEEMLYRTGKTNKENPVPMGASTSKIRVAESTSVNYEQGSFKDTGGTFDFALSGNGFFCVQRPDGQRVYTRNGAFGLDNEGYLSLNQVGRVLSADGEPILLDSENIFVTGDGSIYIKPEGEEGGELEEAGRLRIVSFADNDQLRKDDYGAFVTDQAEQEVQGTEVMWKYLENSNVDMIQEMTDLMKSQKALQSSAQMLRMYDQIMAKSSSDIGRI